MTRLDAEYEKLTAARVWPCPLCKMLIELPDDVPVKVPACDHLIDEHRSEILSGRYTVIVDPRISHG